MFAKYAFLLALGACVVVGCGGDDDDTTGTGGTGGTSGSSGKGGTSNAGASVGGEGGGTAESPLVARGDYLVNHVAACSDCHTPRTATGAPDMTQFLAGAECFVKLPSGDCLHSRNLTNDETGLKNRTDDEIKAMIRDGVRPTATGDEPLSPVMPYYVFHNMTDDDLNAIVAYLRTVPAVEHAVPRSDAAFEVPAPADPLDLDAIPTPDKDFPEHASALRGRYLAAQAGVCIECHTKHVMDAVPLDMTMLFAGGEEFDIGLPVVPISANITSDEDTGIGTWSVADIVKAVKGGIDDEGNRLCPPMPAGPMGAFGGLTDEDATDIANYLKSLPAIANAIDDQCMLPAQ
jgi:mono/diheme cytochrome c family protein